MQSAAGTGTDTKGNPVSYTHLDVYKRQVQRASYVLEAGTYYVRVGVNSRATKVSAAVVLDQETVTEVLSLSLIHI